MLFPATLRLNYRMFTKRRKKIKKEFLHNLLPDNSQKFKNKFSSITCIFGMMPLRKVDMYTRAKNNKALKFIVYY